MADVVAVLQSDPTLLRCQLHRLDGAVDLNATIGDVMGVGYYEGGRVLLRKRPVTRVPLSLEEAGRDVRSELFLASWHRGGAGGFREAETAPYRFRNWLFAGKGRMLPDTEQKAAVADLPEFLQRGLVQASAHELAFFTTLAHMHGDAHQLDHPEIDPEVVTQALRETLAQLDRYAGHAGAAPAQTTAMLSNGRMLVAVRRGRPLSYALLEGIPDCPVCGLDRANGDGDARVRAHRTMKAVALTTNVRKDGVQWIEVPEGHALTVTRTLAVRVAPL